MDSSRASKILTFKVIRVSQLSIEPIFQNTLLTTLPRCPQDWFIHNRACYLILTERIYEKAPIISIKATFLGFLSYFVTFIDLFIQQILCTKSQSLFSSWSRAMKETKHSYLDSIFSQFRNSVKYQVTLTFFSLF